MKQKLRITIWMNMPSFYQSDLFKDLIATGEVDLQIIFARNLTQDRTALGWRTSVDSFPHYFLDSRHRILDAIRLAWLQRDRVHVVNGIWSELSFAVALAAFIVNGSMYCLYSEASNPSSPRSILKKIMQRVFGGLVVNRAVGILAISHLATDFFNRLGARKNSIYPFGYFRALDRSMCKLLGSGTADRIEVVYVGQLVHRKGLDLLLEAIYPLFAEYPSLLLTVIGYGEQLEALRQQAQARGAGQKVRFEGVMLSTMIPARLAAADVLVLPSRWDGWGLVVNEALSVGVPVIVSDHCGASDLIQQGINGYVFCAEDVADLRLYMRNFLEMRTEWARFRANAAAIGERVSTEQAAPYMVECLRHMIGLRDQRPIAPWLALAPSEWRRDGRTAMHSQENA